MNVNAWQLNSEVAAAKDGEDTKGDDSGIDPFRVNTHQRPDDCCDSKRRQSGDEDDNRLFF